MQVFAYEPLGIAGTLVKVEVDVRVGIPAVDIVGLASTSVRESRERVRAAIRNSAYAFPQDRILINLAPADLPKEGSLYDLPIAVKILAETGQLPDPGRPFLVVGELTLDGCVNPVRGVLPALLKARASGIRHFLVPQGNAREVERLGEENAFPVGALADVGSILGAFREGRRPRSPRVPAKGLRDESEEQRRVFDFSDYLGNPKVVRALCVAAVGRHNLLLFGPPGSGKTMAALRYPSILPPLTEAEALEVAAIWSLRGRDYSGAALTSPPFLCPHHSASLEGLVGGGRPPLPGEISLAHRGILFMDESPEFRRDALQALREPLERGRVSIVRAGRVIVFPADFQLLMAANACPCGNLGSRTKTCLCSPVEIQRYWKKLGGPLLDRIDLRIPLAMPNLSSSSPEDRPDQAGLVESVRRASAARLGRRGSERHHHNGRLEPAEVEVVCSLSAAGSNLLGEKVESLGLSARACHSVLKVARSVADLDGKEKIDEASLLEAVGYRSYGEGDAYWPF